MGWTTMAMPEEGARAFLDSLHSWRNDQQSYQVIDSALVGGREYYAAVERIEAANGDRMVFAGIALVHISRRQGEEFGYKSMSEDMGPTANACPLRILNKLTATNHQTSLLWRASCRVAAAHRSTKGKGPRLVPGQRIRFARPIRFSNGAELSEFEIERQVFSGKLVFIDPETRNRYRITGAQRRERSLISIANTAACRSQQAD